MVLPITFAPVLLLCQLGPVQEWPLLRALARNHRVLTEADPLFQWILAVANNDNKLLHVAN